jgi:hypothetical protein
MELIPINLNRQNFITGLEVNAPTSWLNTNKKSSSIGAFFILGFTLSKKLGRFNYDENCNKRN